MTPEEFDKKTKREAWKQIKEAQEQILQSTWLGKNYKQNMDLAIEILWEQGLRQQDYENYQDYVLRNMYLLNEEEFYEEQEKIKESMEEEFRLLDELYGED